MSGERYVITITAIPSHRTATQRLKCLLKTLLRSHGFRCDELRPALHDEMDCPSEATTTRQTQSQETEETGP